MLFKKSLDMSYRKVFKLIVCVYKITQTLPWSILGEPRRITFIWDTDLLTYNALNYLNKTATKHHHMVDIFQFLIRHYIVSSVIQNTIGKYWTACNISCQWWFVCNGSMTSLINQHRTTTVSCWVLANILKIIPGHVCNCFTRSDDDVWTNWCLNEPNS